MWEDGGYDVVYKEISVYNVYFQDYSHRISILVIVEFKGGIIMQKYLCEPCGYIYDPEEGDPDNGIAPGTEFENIPDDWLCPLCGLGKDAFVPVED